MWHTPTILALVLVALISIAVPAHSEPFNISVEPIKHFDPANPGKTRFGQLEFLGGMLLTSEHEDFGGISAFRFIEGGPKFIALTDKARVITGHVIRQDNALVGITGLNITRIRDSKGRTITGAEQKDSESIEFVGDSIAVGYERDDRIAFFNMNKQTLVMDPRRPPIDFNRFELTNNKGLEGIALHPDGTRLYAVPEYARNDDGHLRVFVVKDDRVSAEAELTSSDGFSNTDVEFLPNGDLLILQRYYNPFTGVFMKLKRVPAQSIDSPDPWEPIVLLEADGDFEIDNMEALSVTVLEDGGTRITMISDDNFSRSQRTVLLEFRLLK